MGFIVLLVSEKSLAKSYTSAGNNTVKTDVSVQHGCVIMMSSGKVLIGI